MSRILVLDVETSPNLAYVWRLFKENVGVNQIREHTTLLSYAAKWLGQPQIFYEDCRHMKNDNLLLQGLCRLISEADMVVAHNGRKFDMKQVRGRALINGAPIPPPVKVVDTLEIAKKEFGFVSNKLAYLAEVLGVEKKGDHAKFPGFELWKECLADNMEAWEELKEYNIQDIITLEQVYLKLRPWATEHPNVAVYEDVANAVLCPKCGGKHVHKRGFAHTSVAVYQRYQCNDCGGWARSRYQETPKGKNLLVNVV